MDPSRNFEVSRLSKKLGVRFVAAALVEIQIKHIMKISCDESDGLFFSNSNLVVYRIDQSFPKGSASRSTFEDFDDDDDAVSKNRSIVELKRTEFHLAAPFAESVKLAAEFTDWEKFPLDMVKAEDGVWYTVVPLPPGHYSYRFIVDGEWCDDPRPIFRLHNSPFGRVNAMVEVT